MPAIATLKKKLRAGDVAERCGLVLKNGRLIETENTHEDPIKGFRIDARELLKHEDNLAGTWHTHPGMSANLSNEDRKGFLQWPHLTHYIIGTDGVRSYVVEDGMVMCG